MRLYDIALILAIVVAVACGIVEIAGMGSCIPEVPTPTQPKES